LKAVSDGGEPTRFVIVGRARTGTTLLRSLLKSHPQIRCYSELLNLNKRYSGGDLGRLLNDPVRYLKGKLEPKENKDVDAVGFKVLYDQGSYKRYKAALEKRYDRMHNDLRIDQAKVTGFIDGTYDPADIECRLKRVWQWLREDKTLKILHLKRKNRLRTLVSLAIAEERNEWLFEQQTGKQRKKVTLDPVWLERNLRNIVSQEMEHDLIFGSHDTLEIHYEDIAGGTTDVLKGMQQFLAVEPTKLRSSLKKQNPQPLEQLIQNYSEVREYFIGSEWGELFQVGERNR